MVRRNNYLDEASSALTATALGVWGAYGLKLGFPGVFENLEQAIISARHASKTAIDAARGGPEGYRSAKKLEEALDTVEGAASFNAEAAKALKNYEKERKELALQLVSVYKENETLARVSGRLKVQLEGSLKSFFEVGNEAKPKIFRKIDDTIIKLYGKDPVKAREESGRLKEFYKNVNKFYDAREKNEHTVSEFCDYLEGIKKTSEDRNKELNEQFPELIARVKQGYSVEDIIFDSGKNGIFGLRGKVSKKEARKVEENVGKFREGVDKTYESTREVAGIEEYKESNLAEIILDPVTIGLASALVFKGASKLLPPFAEKPLTRVLGLPVSFPARFISKKLRKNKVDHQKDNKGE